MKGSSSLPLTREQHLDRTLTPKRILALDGGGIRGILTWLSTEIKVDYASDALAKIAEMDDPSNMDELAEIGSLAATKQVKAEHFPARFDVG